MLLGAACWHLATLFLAVTPDNPVKSRYAHLINGHVYPEFTQGWQLFAPEPLHENVIVEARVRTARDSGNPHTGQWADLTTQDVEAIRHTVGGTYRSAPGDFSSPHISSGSPFSASKGDLAVSGPSPCRCVSPPGRWPRPAGATGRRPRRVPATVRCHGGR